MLNQPQSMTALRTAVALDPHLKVLIAHGLFDLATPYLATQLLLDQIPTSAGGDQVRLTTNPGGHMSHGRDTLRMAFRAEVQTRYSAE